MLLVLIYRSPVFWLIPLLAVLFAEAVVRGLGTLLAEAGVVINGQTGGILLVLVFGAGTDYALLLTARYREELVRLEDKHEAMQVALRQGGPAIVASAGTVVAALLCLSFARVDSIAGLGPVGAMGVAVAAAAMLTCFRRYSWSGAAARSGRSFPDTGTSVPKLVASGHASARGSSAAIGPRGSTALALGALALGTLGLDDDLTTSNLFRGSVESVRGQRLLEQSFPAGAARPPSFS